MSEFVTFGKALVTSLERGARAIKIELGNLIIRSEHRFGVPDARPFVRKLDEETRDALFRKLAEDAYKNKPRPLNPKDFQQ